LLAPGSISGIAIDPVTQTRQIAGSDVSYFKITLENTKGQWTVWHRFSNFEALRRFVNRRTKRTPLELLAPTGSLVLTTLRTLICNTQQADGQPPGAAWKTAVRFLGNAGIPRKAGQGPSEFPGTAV
jgi:hypothetical protein